MNRILSLDFCFRRDAPRAIGGAAVVAAIGFCLLPWLLPSVASADEGMWLYNNPPRQLLRQKYGFELTDNWLENLQLASVHFGGGSGEFVSKDGLVLSNHHVGSRAVQRLSTREHNYLRDGFYARTRAEEKPCAGLELRVLMNIEDVTAQVNASVAPGLSDEAAFKARRAAMAAIEKAASDQTGLRSEVITSTRAASTIFTAIRNTRTSGSCSRPRNRSPFTAATRTTSNTPASTSISACSAPTRTASPPGRLITSSGARLAPPTVNWFSSPVIRATLTACEHLALRLSHQLLFFSEKNKWPTQIQ